jgi:hypothetical protein
MVSRKFRYGNWTIQRRVNRASVPGLVGSEFVLRGMRCKSSALRQKEKDVGRIIDCTLCHEKRAVRTRIWYDTPRTFVAYLCADCDKLTTEEINEQSYGNAFSEERKPSRSMHIDVELERMKKRENWSKHYGHNNF